MPGYFSETELKKFNTAPKRRFGVHQHRIGRDEFTSLKQAAEHIAETVQEEFSVDEVGDGETEYKVIAK